MSQYPKNLLEMYASDPDLIPTRNKAVSPEDLAKRTEEHEEKYATEINPEARTAGRPRKVLPRRLTEVRSLRLETTLWGTLEARVEIEGCSINRYIEEAILSKLGILQEKSSISESSLIGAFTINDAYFKQADIPSIVITFQPIVAA